MAVTLRREHDNTYRVDIAGRLRKPDLDTVQQAVAAELRGGATIRLLVVLTQFEGWERDADWRDLTFYVRHGDAIERIALVGDEAWRSEALMFVGADLRKGDVRYFAAADEAGAVAWLAG